MTESQNIEYKSSWRDEYLKWICGFANANGGKFRVFYYRSGSTKQELKGTALHAFLLRKMGKSWDGISSENASMTEIDDLSVHLFVRKALDSKRISSEVNPVDIEGTLQNLNLLNEHNKPTNAALLVFGKNPLKYFTTAYFKIGRFGASDHDLLFQDVVEGNILTMADKVIEILRSKYLVSPIHYQGLQRFEELEYPAEALREAILNAIVHKDYTGAPIQMSVYNDRLILWNPGRLPDDITIEILLQKHPSRPANKNIAELFFKAGYIEVWGRGIAKILSACQQGGLPEPILEEYAGGIQITFAKKGRVVEKVVEKVVENLTAHQKLILENIFANPKISALVLSSMLGLSHRKTQENMKKLKDKGLLERIGPAKGGYWQVIEQH